MPYFSRSVLESRCQVMRGPRKFCQGRGFLSPDEVILHIKIKGIEHGAS